MMLGTSVKSPGSFWLIKHNGKQWPCIIIPAKTLPQSFSATKGSSSRLLAVLVLRKEILLWRDALELEEWIPSKDYLGQDAKEYNIALQTFETRERAKAFSEVEDMRPLSHYEYIIKWKLVGQDDDEDDDAAGVRPPTRRPARVVSLCSDDDEDNDSMAGVRPSLDVKLRHNHPLIKQEDVSMLDAPEHNSSERSQTYIGNKSRLDKTLFSKQPGNFNTNRKPSFAPEELLNNKDEADAKGGTTKKEPQNSKSKKKRTTITEGISNCDSIIASSQRSKTESKKSVTAKEVSKEDLEARYYTVKMHITCSRRTDTQQ